MPTSTLTVRTNGVSRLLIDDYQLTPAERADFDYLDWQAIDAGTESATFFRYLGTLYALDQFMRTPDGFLSDHGLPARLTTWDGYLSDSFFSGILIRRDPADSDRIIVGRFYA